MNMITIAEYKRIILVSFALIVLAFVSCNKDWLEAKANNTQAIPSTLKDFQAMLDNPLMNNSAISLGEEASDEHYTSESAFLMASDRAKNAYTWSHDKPYLYPELIDWTFEYNRILKLNIILDALKKIKEPNFENVKGQALYHRADAFFRIAQVWAPPYSDGLDKNTLGIPLKLESDVNVLSKRSFLHDTYNQILSDLKDASQMLPVTAQYRTRPCKIAAFGLLARIYLSIKDTISAFRYADSALSKYNSLIDYNNLQFSENYVGDFRSNEEVIFDFCILTTSARGGFLENNCYILDSFYKKYDTNDLRHQVFFLKRSDGMITFKGNYLNSSSNLFSGIATDELYLIRAECLARQGKTSEALNDLNTLLVNRYKKGEFLPFKNLSKDSTLHVILEERQKELLLRGLRWSDLRRLNTDARFANVMRRTISGKTYILEPGSFRYTFPIPDDIISASGIEQNPGW